MLHKPLLISPSQAFWDAAAGTLLGHSLLVPAYANQAGQPLDMSAVRVVTPTFAHAQLLKTALVQQAGAAFIPPRITTLAAWCSLLLPESAPPAAAGARLMDLYAELRQHAWLKKLFSARRNTDLLPLAQMLLTLSDELTLCLLPTIANVQDTQDAAHLRWQKALEQLSPAARHMVSDEAQLVWSIWKSQLDGSDALAIRYRQTMRLAELASEALVWIAPAAPELFDLAFLQAYGERQTVVPILFDWEAVAPALAAAWPELQEEHAEGTEGAQAAETMRDDRVIEPPQRVALCPAGSMEQEAQFGAQTVIGWLLAGKSSIAVIAQDRVVARRLRALLERAQVFVADETGWKLSTTRAASAVVAWFEVVATRAETIALLDLLKSPFAFAALEHKETQLMVMEACLRNANVLGGWEAVTHALAAAPVARELVASLAQQAALFGGRKTIAQWSTVTEAGLQALGMWQALLQDAAGAQVVALLQAIAGTSNAQTQAFSFAEWRAFIALQLEDTAYLAPGADRRVVMLPLNGAQLRPFDAVLMLGCDAEHLPSQPNETLFFANAVRRELGLATRESRQRQQLRDFAALLSSGGAVVLSWQTHHDGEPNPASPWILRLQLILKRAGAATLPTHRAPIGKQQLRPMPATMPAPSAPQLLPPKLSASGYNSLVACPYQFFATRMLALSGLDELTDMPEKRDYGDWLHQILNTYHEAVRDRNIPAGEREPLLRQISATVFDTEVANNAAALGYYARWQKALPAYLAWADAREAEGWHFAFGERKFEKLLRWEDGEITLHGRIDRIDETDAGQRAVLDYKTKNVSALRERLKQREDHQLAFYGILSDQPVDHAHYVALETMKDKTGDAEAADYAEWQSSLEQQIKIDLHAMTHGAALPATGIESVCAYCAVRGLCRKGAW
ncbi:MAG: PD-(D/E)XK nuclease family protein [Burkholderiales bacterium]